MHIIGLTGGIGSGKSEATKIFSSLGAKIIDLDIIAHDLTLKNALGYSLIIEHFGDDFLNNKKEIDRKKLRKSIFEDKNSNIKVNTICRGKAMSAAAMILACGTGKRLASKRSTIMIHEGSSMQAGKSSDLKAAHKYNAHLEDMANAILGEKTTKDKKFWSEHTKTDLYLSSKDAQKLGVIDGIIN